MILGKHLQSYVLCHCMSNKYQLNRLFVIIKVNKVSNISPRRSKYDCLYPRLEDMSAFVVSG